MHQEKGVCVITKNGAKTHSNSSEIKGTFVILRLKNKEIKNIYEYLKFKHINRIEDNYDKI